MTEEDQKQIREIVRLEFKPLHDAQADFEFKLKRDLTAVLKIIRDDLKTTQVQRTSDIGERALSLLKGALKSWTIWVNAIIFALPDVLPLVLPDLQVLRDPAVDWTVKLTAAANILTRLKTNESLSQKGEGRKNEHHF